MTRDEFWKLVDTAREQADDDLEQEMALLQEQLVKLPATEIIEFQKRFDELHVEAYRWDLWAAAYLIQGGCSDDGFAYFCSGLIAAGRGMYEKTLKAPDSLADGEPFEDCEEMQYAGRQAYEEKTGEEMPEYDSPAYGEPKNPDWKFDFDDEAEMKRRLPKLFAVYGAS